MLTRGILKMFIITKMVAEIPERVKEIAVKQNRRFSSKMLFSYIFLWFQSSEDIFIYKIAFSVINMTDHL